MVLKKPHSNSHEKMFLGFETSKSWTEEFKNCIQPMHEALIDFPIRWIPETNYHITFFYFGEITFEIRESIMIDMQDIKTKPFEMPGLSWSLFGKFSPRAITLEFDIKDPNLIHLIEQTNTFLTKRGFEGINTFRPHLTFARHKGQISIETANQLTETLYPFPVPTAPLTIDKLILFKTATQQETPRYIPAYSVTLF